MTRLSFGLIVTLIFQSCTSSINEVDTNIKQTELSKEKAEDVTIIYSQHGRTKARLYTKTFIQHKEEQPPYVEMQDGVKVEFFNDTLGLTSTLTAKRGKYYEQTQNVIVRDSVVVTNDKQERLETEELIWNEKKQRFYSDKYVQVSTPLQTIHGDGLEANQDFSWYKITNVRGEIGVEKSRIPTLQ